MNKDEFYKDSGDFYYSVACNRVNDVKRRIEKEKLNPNIQVRLNDTKPYRPLLVAASANGAIDMIEYLISIGADVNAKDEKGNTALIEAVKSNQSREIQKSTVYQLLKAGADKKIKSRGKTALDLAKSESIKKLLLADKLPDRIDDSPQQITEFTIEALEAYYDRRMPKSYKEFIKKKTYAKYEGKKFCFSCYDNGVEVRFVDKDKNGRYHVPDLLDDAGDYDEDAAANMIPFGAIYFETDREPQFLTIDVSKADSPVYMFEHETGEFEKAAKNIQEFLKKQLK